MEAIKSKAFSLGLLSNPGKIISLLDDLKNNVRTDIQIWEIKDALSIANSIGDKGTIEHYVMSTQNVLRETTGLHNDYVLLPTTDDYEEIQELFANILE